MPAGDYYLNKFNGSSIDEKIFIAEANKVLGFDAQLNPVMISCAYVTAMSTDYIPKYNGSSFTNSCMRQAGIGIGVNYDEVPLASIHAAAVTGFPIAQFSSHDDQSTIYRHLFFIQDNYGGEIGLIGQVPGFERNLVCLHDDGAIGIGYNSLRVYEDAGTVGIGLTSGETPAAPFHLKTSGTPLAIFETTAMAATGDAFVFVVDSYGSELGFVGNYNGFSREMVCVHANGSIGLGYNAFTVWENESSVSMEVYSAPSVQFQMNEAACNTTRTAFLIYIGDTTITPSSKTALDIRNSYDYNLFNVTANRDNSLTTIGNLTSGSHSLSVYGIITATGGSSANWNAAYTHSQSAHAYIPYTGGTSNVNLGVHDLTVDTTTLFVNSINHRVGFGTITPACPFHLLTTGVLATNTVMFQNDTVNGRVIQLVGMTATAGGAAFDMRAHGSSYVETLFSNSMADATLLMGNANSIFVIGNYTAADLIFGTNNAERIRLKANGNTSFGMGSTATAIIHIKAGTASAGTAPLKFASGIKLTTPEAGAFEFDGANLYFTPVSTRLTVSFSNHTHSYEPALGNPAGNGYILSSTTLGVRSWIAAPATHNAVTIGTSNGLSLSTQVLSLATASTSVTGALTSTDWNTFNNKVSFPGFGTSNITAAYGDHTHSNYDNYNQWTFQPETALGMGSSYTISSGYFIQLKAGTGMDLSHSITGSTVTVTLTSSGGFPGFGTTHTTAAYGDHTHSNYDNYNQWTFQAFNGAYDEFTVLSGNTLRFSTGPNIEFDLADLAADGILVMSVVNIPDIILTGYTYGSIGLIAATDSLKVGLSKLQTQMPKTLYYDISDFVNVGSGVNDISPYTLPANTLAYDGQRLEMLYSGISAANTNGKTIQFYFGGTSYITITNSSATSLNWFLRITLIRYSSTYFKLRFDGGWNVVGYGTGFGMSINYAANNIIKLTAQGGATNDITCKLVTITQFSI